MCFDAYAPAKGCELNIDLCVSQPGEMDLMVATIAGDSIMQLLSSVTQRVPDSSHKFDLCMLHAGDYQLVLRTRQGQKYRRTITLN